MVFDHGEKLFTSYAPSGQMSIKIFSARRAPVIVGKTSGADPMVFGACKYFHVLEILTADCALQAFPQLFYGILQRLL